MAASSSTDPPAPEITVGKDWFMGDYVEKADAMRWVLNYRGLASSLTLTARTHKYTTSEEGQRLTLDPKTRFILFTSRGFNHNNLNIMACPDRLVVHFDPPRIFDGAETFRLEFPKGHLPLPGLHVTIQIRGSIITPEAWREEEFYIW